MEAVEYKPMTSKDDFHGLDADQKLARSEYFVECTSAEFDYIWDKHYDENDSEDKLEWIQDSSGFGRHLGFIGNKKKERSVFVTFSFYAIGGKYICFYRCDSRYSDWTMIDEYINKLAPEYFMHGSMRKAKTTASRGNFHNVLRYCRGEFKK